MAWHLPLLPTSLLPPWPWPACPRFRFWRRRVCLPAALLLGAFMLIGFLEEHGGVQRWAIDLPTGLLARLLVSPPPPGDRHPTWRVLKFPDGQLRVGSDHLTLHYRLPTGQRQLDSVRRDVFNRNVIGCSVGREFGSVGWKLCAVGAFALAGNGSCVAVFVSDRAATEFQEQLTGGLPCSTVLGFSSSGQPLRQPGSDTAELLPNLLRRAASRDAPIDALLVEYLQRPADQPSAVEAAAHEGLLESVKQLVLVTPEAVKRPLHQLTLLTALHDNGFRQWSHRRLPAEKCPGLQAACWHQRLVNVRFLLDRAGLAKATPGFEAANELLLAQLAGQSAQRLRQLLQSSVTGRRPHVLCPRNRSLGAGDDRWDVCFSEAFNVAAAEPSCVALIFDGSNSSGSSSSGGANVQASGGVHFYDELVDQFSCWVFTFSAGAANRTLLPRNRQRKTLWHFRARLGRSNRVDVTGLKVRTLCSVINRLGYDADRPIDIVKVDARDPQELTAGLSSAIKDGCLHQVKQLILVTCQGPPADSQLDSLAAYVGVWQNLMRLGFRVWQSRSLPMQTPPGEYPAACCHVHYLVNLHFSGLSLYVEKL